MLVAVLALFFYAAVYFAYQWMQTRVNAVLGPDTAARHLDVDGHTANQESTLFTHEAAIQQILAHNIFNAALDTRPPQAGQNFRLHELAASSGPLELLGTVSGSDSDARAIIRAGAGQREQLYRLGDVIQGAEIVRIERGRVALATKTGPELLLLKERDSGPAAPAQEGAALLEENPLLTPLQDQADSSYNSNHASSRIVPRGKLPSPTRPRQQEACQYEPARLPCSPWRFPGKYRKTRPRLTRTGPEWLSSCPSSLFHS